LKERSSYIWLIHKFNLIDLSPEDAFRAADKDFDGFINKNDLNQFLLEVVHF